MRHKLTVTQENELEAVLENFLTLSACFSMVVKKAKCILSITRKEAEKSNSKNDHTAVKIYHAFSSQIQQTFLITLFHKKHSEERER